MIVFFALFQDEGSDDDVVDLFELLLQNLDRNDDGKISLKEFLES